MFLTLSNIGDDIKYGWTTKPATKLEANINFSDSAVDFLYLENGFLEKKFNFTKIKYLEKSIY